MKSKRKICTALKEQLVAESIGSLRKTCDNIQTAKMYILSVKKVVKFGLDDPSIV